MKHHQEHTPATREELRWRLPIDLLVFQLLETFESFTKFDPRGYKLHLLGLPSHVTTVAATTEALEQDPDVALNTLDRVMDAVDGYLGICELEEWPEDAARLQVCWDQFDELLAAMHLTIRGGPRIADLGTTGVGDTRLAA
jgi:ABC-type transport system involved in cytochrome bd biosynthesis fused ATPase/permease subunit